LGIRGTLSEADFSGESRLGLQMDPSVRAKSGSRHGTEVRRDGFQCNRAFQIVDVVFGKFVLFGTGYDAI
jgi:hypothetical protein